MINHHRTSKKILLISSEHDPVMAFFVNWIKSNGYDNYVNLYQEDHGVTWFAEIVNGNVKFITLEPSITYSSDNIIAIYDRLAGIPPSSSMRDYAGYQLLETCINCIDTLVINRPYFLSLSSSKPYQHKHLNNHGLELPQTRITNTSSSLTRFCNDSNQGVIFKSISSCRSIVHQVDLDDLDRLSRLKYCPVQFQKREIGDDIRVHVISDKVFPVKIRSQAVDYRYSSAQGYKATFEIVDLPFEVRSACIEATKNMGLIFSGVDLIQSEDGTYRCFEINPQPGYSSFERNSRVPISAALYQYIMQERRE